MLAHKLILKRLYVHLKVLPLPLSANLFITIVRFRHHELIGLVYSIHDSTEEVAIQKMIDASKKC